MVAAHEVFAVTLAGAVGGGAAVGVGVFHGAPPK